MVHMGTFRSTELGVCPEQVFECLDVCDNSHEQGGDIFAQDGSLIQMATLTHKDSITTQATTQAALHAVFRDRPSYFLNRV